MRSDAATIAVAAAGPWCVPPYRRLRPSTMVDAAALLAAECRIDARARAAWRDPLQYRRERLAAAPALRDGLDAAAWRAGWGRDLAPGRARGVALALSAFGGWVVQIAEVGLDAGGQPRLERLTTQHDGLTPDRRDVAAPAIANALAALQRAQRRALRLTTLGDENSR